MGLSLSKVQCPIGFADFGHWTLDVGLFPLWLNTKKDLF